MQQQRDAVFLQLEKIHATLVQRAKHEEPSLLSRLSPDPPESRKTGYRLLPGIKENEPFRQVEPTQTFYSLKWVESRMQAEMQNASELYDQLPGSADLENVVIRFEESEKRLRNLEDNLSYQAKWQKAVLRYPTYFRKKNELLVMARELSALVAEGASRQQIAELRHQLLKNAAPFKPTPGLQVHPDSDGGLVLPVTVCTDIEDSNFLIAFKQGVYEAFNLSEAALEKQFSIELSWRKISPGRLYPDGVPARGSQIDMNDHHARFTECPLVLTTGAVSLNAGVGNRIYLGTKPVSPRTLAHEFGHLLGFEDSYLRGYDGDPGDPYGVVFVEWSGLSSDLMGDSRRGQVSEDMINTLIREYSLAVPEHRLNLTVHYPVSCRFPISQTKCINFVDFLEKSTIVNT